MPEERPEEIWGVVLAGGAARRFGRAKQFEQVGGLRMIDRTVAAARTACDRVAVVLPAGVGWDGEPVDALAVGGHHQSDSLRAALAVLPASATVAVVADPAHPLASPELFAAVVRAVLDGADGAVPVVPVLEVVQRVVDGRVVATLPKDDLVITQSPQAFRVAALRAAHADRPRPVENSGLLVEHGHRVVTVPGDPANIHVSTPRELALADLLAPYTDLTGAGAAG